MHKRPSWITTRSVWAAAGVLVAAVVAVLAWSRSESPRPVRPANSFSLLKERPGGNPGYTGPQACAECHPAHVTELADSPHFRTCRPPQADEMPPGFAPGRRTYVARFPGVRFEMNRSGEEFVQTAIRTTSAGELRTTTPIDLVLGAGTADDVYLSWGGDGHMFELPIAWLWPLETWGASHFCHAYGEGDFSRPATVRCLECHNTWIEHVPGTQNQYRREGAILGVTCERCHGPGHEHVVYHKAHPEATSGHAIVHPRELERERQIEVCTQCHSNAISHREPPFSYRPGEPLEKYFRTSTVTRSEDDHVANQVQHLRESKCFQKSESLTCISCHDPHPGKDSTVSARASCLKCHEPGHCGEHERLPAPLRTDCVGCHMPKRIKINVKFETEDDNFVPPIRRYQHRIAVYPSARNEVLLAWHRAQPAAENQEQAARLTDVLVEHWMDEAETMRGQHRFLAAIAAVREALSLEERPQLRAELKELVEIQTTLYDQWAKALHLIAENRSAEAVETLKSILRIKPDDAESHSKLGTLYAMAGQRRLATEHLLAVARYDPNNPSGYGVLGKMASTYGQLGDAVKYFRLAAGIEPFNAQIQFDLGTSLARTARLPEALEHLQRAQAIDPTRVDVLGALADVLAESGRLDEAIQAATRALDLARTTDPALTLHVRRQLEALQSRTERNAD